MTGASLSRMEKVHLREHWKNEATDFTPWLAQNIDMLGDVIGVALECRETESWADNGAGRADIVAITVNDERPVIIENQLEFTDEGHLARLLMYAADKDARLVIWVFRGVHEAHWAVLDWLNRQSGGNVQYFGVVVELWRIDGSKPAPHLRVVAAPPGWRDPNAGDLNASLPELRRQYNSFREMLEERLSREHGYSVPDDQSPRQPWCVLEALNGIGHYSVDFRHRQNIGVNLVIGGRSSSTPEWNQRRMEQLKQSQADIETALLNADLGEWFKWLPSGSLKRSFVSVYRDGNIYNNQELWDEYHDWIIDKFFRFRETLEPYLQELPGN